MKQCGWRLTIDLIRDVKDLADSLGMADSAAAAMLLREGLTAYAERHKISISNTAARRYRNDKS